jgi:hypothetical protein
MLGNLTGLNSTKKYNKPQMQAYLNKTATILLFTILLKNFKENLFVRNPKTLGVKNKKHNRREITATILNIAE